MLYWNHILWTWWFPDQNSEVNNLWSESWIFYATLNLLISWNQESFNFASELLWIYDSYYHINRASWHLENLLKIKQQWKCPDLRYTLTTEVWSRSSYPGSDHVYEASSILDQNRSDVNKSRTTWTSVFQHCKISSELHHITWYGMGFLSACDLHRISVKFEGHKSFSNLQQGIANGANPLLRRYSHT